MSERPKPSNSSSSTVTEDRESVRVAPPPPLSQQTQPFHRRNRHSSSSKIPQLTPILQAYRHQQGGAAHRPQHPPPQHHAEQSLAASDHADWDSADDFASPPLYPRPVSRHSDTPPPLHTPPGEGNHNAPPSDDEDGVDGFFNDEEQPPTSADQAALLLFREKWKGTFSEDSTWEEFTTHCTTFATAARELAISLKKSHTSRTPKPSSQSRPPTSRRPPQGRPIPRFDPTEARRLQGLYYHSKRRAARKILGNNNTIFTGSIDDTEQYFTTSLAEKFTNTSILQEQLDQFTPTAREEPTTELLYDELRQSEIAAKLGSAANTAPNSDRCEYAHLKKVDPTAAILSLIFNRCHVEKDVPQPWKDAVTILIYKKGDTDDISNFRPIALMSTMYKLFMGVLAKRLTKWSIYNGILSDEQKSARPSEGCYEHTFLLKSIVADSRRRKQKLCMAWLDIRNAFGSISHDVIRSSLQHIGVPADMIQLIGNAYSGASTTIKTPAGSTASIPIRAGVKQGCPLSPIIFNLCMELILRMVKSKASQLRSGVCKFQSRTVSCLAYADDLVLLARSPDALQQLLDRASDAASVLGFEFRPDKCATLFLTTEGKRHLWTDRHDFILQGDHLPALENEQSYRYLGVPIGVIHNIDDIPTIIPRLIHDLHSINSSLLAPWQKLDAIRTFIQPCLTYALRAGDPLKKSLSEYRSLLVRVLREICNLPTRATQSYFFAAKKAGGLGFQDPLVECDMQAIVQAVRVLSSNDDNVTTIAKEDLRAFVRQTAQSNTTADLISKYLSAKDDPRLRTLHYSSHSSLWSRVRKACRRQNIAIRFSDTEPPTISADESDAVKSNQVSSFLHRLAQQRYADSLAALPDQGKVARCLAEDIYANGSSWHMNGLNIRFKDWRFIHRARLNVLPLNANKSRFSHTDPTCRHCTQPETLPHVLCHCRPLMTQMRERHDLIVDRISNAVRFGDVTTDRAVQNSGLRLRPDIVVEEQDDVLIIDVTCPFDNDDNALADAAQTKLNKYEPLKQHFIGLGKRCEIHPFVIGALGSWYRPNELLCTRLGMTRRYKNLFRKLCCSDAIRGSTDIYRLHLGCDLATQDAQ
ncbi:uncharacterized protein LOC124449166 [Xenia sp. Carnegie-2017]|uniref:uncharacterized protein LOC124449166 n=1 Tax=Xenia sp. Carnegie-2017 TaxID=2897299 RepID=UPI001F03829E|nr:uncharacterized protein LOC124449166 [Xenia sp. Carnegie-2017]